MLQISKLSGIKQIEGRINLDQACFSELNLKLFKEVLRRENQGLKVYPVDGSSVFSMTGTYF